MIDCQPLENIKELSKTTYTLINKQHISGTIIDKLRKNKTMNTTTINDLYRILNCKTENIAQYITSDNDQSL